ncbi:hypothetical protein ACI77I_26030 [Pseudomonas sp. D47]|uniref:hypothetical protein n=1 Tax=Pseudomonas sp. D47 TaxID=3159447 RepID=UPI00387AC625
MATIEFRLEHGLPFGKGDDAQMQYDVTLRELNVGDLLAAQEEAEKVVATPDGYSLVISPTRVGIHMIRRQVASVGCIKGPLSIGDINRLHADDLGLLNSKAGALEQAALKELESRGRSNTAPAST